MARSQAGAGKAPKPLLVVDDDDEHREGLRHLLEGEGYAVADAEDGRQALDYLIASAATPGVVLLDLNMPTMTGWELLAVMKCYTRLAHIPVVLISGDLPKVDLIRHGAVAAVMRKPYNPDELLALLGKLTTNV